ncbi:MAG: phosphonate ABC transporter, permease protein PhnE [Lactococcus lactis]|nr:phosphonate ABC transporter, permease protein PhnE [Lactococcus lactis]
MYDKIFKPKKIKLITGEVVEEKVSRTWLTWLIIILLIAFSVILTNFDFSALSRSGLFFQKLASMIPPNWAYFHKVLPPLLDTIKMSFFASLLGAILSVPFAILAANNILKNRFGNGIIRLIFMLARTLPTLVLALIATYIFGLGTFAGVVAIFVFTFSFIGKQLFEVIETVDMGPFEAAEALGVSPLKAFFIAVFPQVLPTYLSTALYAFEGNVRYAAILGYVGAGGIGNILNDRVNFRDFSSVGMFLISILATVMIIDSISALIRKKIA